VERRNFAQDFFFELMRDSQRVRAVYLAERERWIRTLDIGGREEILFELEMLLRGIDRFFTLRNLFGETPPPPERDFREELKSARDALHRAAHLARRLIVQKQEQALLFRSFVEGSLADDRSRARFGAELREQRTPEESLFLLRSGLTAHQGILDNLLRVDFAPQSLFLDVGRALQHELFVSRYFCPPAALEFRGEYDRVASVRLLEALRQTYEDKKRRAFALALLGAFRSLRSLRYVPAPPVPHTRRVLVILALVRSELQALIGYLESDLARMVATVEGVGGAAAAGRAAAVPIREALEVLFDDEGRLEQSQRLRMDLHVFRELCRNTAQKLEEPGANVSLVLPLRRFAFEFRDVGYQLLRHSDRELFDRFLDLLDGWGRSLENTPARLQKLREDCRRFGEILDRALENVNKRAELQKVPLDDAAVQQALASRLRGG
jgi:hypothetical protein